MEECLKSLPPQLLKWVGNKQRIARQIVDAFPLDFGVYYEPFLGSGAVMGALAPNCAVGSDVLPALIRIWDRLVHAPEELISDYDRYRAQIDKGVDKRCVYRRALDDYNLSNDDRAFVFLSRACYGGVIRFRKADGYMSTPVGAHMPISTESFRKRVYSWRERVVGATFDCMDYREAFELPQSGDLVYCDPPYVDTQKILYGAQSFDFDDLIGCIDDAKSRGVRVAMSIDGSKQGGRKWVDLDLPRNLFESEVRISVGKSMLRRFQLAGEVLDGEEVVDRLLLTYGL
ncbi:DNA adenine methylase [Actinomyces sp. oral taxon 180]|uniref:DNA adenine methylase n=1 Tax=Actinomyces sp. oral taxon 180 TaxID=651609 RepID=UPI0001F1621B|nr:Dam family site-specific DNA-(adenine-N6)-methyltransferase [Actinomyces sp. oral taxon 180]EFU60363.1 DNA adenine methylase [Actinomyces sp. oral taxon 180 str. F0310]